MSKETRRSWYYVASDGDGPSGYVIKAGEETIGFAESEGNAEFICRANREICRQ